MLTSILKQSIQEIKICNFDFNGETSLFFLHAEFIVLLIMEVSFVITLIDIFSES